MTREEMLYEEALDQIENGLRGASVNHFKYSAACEFLRPVLLIIADRRREEDEKLKEGEKEWEKLAEKMEE